MDDARPSVSSAQSVICCRPISFHVLARCLCSTHLSSPITSWHPRTDVVKACCGRWDIKTSSPPGLLDVLDLPAPLSLPGRLPVHRGSFNSSNLRPLDRVVPSVSESCTLRLALIHVGTLANKTFLLNDFFSLRELEFMFLTEIWLRQVSSRNSPSFFLFSVTFSAPVWPLGKGGGLASVFKSSCHCRPFLFDSYNTFELQLFEAIFAVTVRAVVYHPPKYNKGFIRHFADFVAGGVLKYDTILIVGDYDIHVCCESRPLVRDFLNLIDSFNLAQSVVGPTNEKGHTLDLMLSVSLSGETSKICDTCISDYLPVLFTSSLDASTSAPVRRQHPINPLTAFQFSAAFRDTVLYTLDDSDLSSLCF